MTKKIEPVQSQQLLKSPYIHPQQAIIQAMEWHIPVQWFGLQGIHTLDNGRVAIITLIVSRVEDKNASTGFQVEICSKTTGTIARYFFDFNVFLLPKQPAGQQDDCKGGFYSAWTEWPWNVDIPVATRPLIQAIEQWIELFRLAPYLPDTYDPLALLPVEPGTRNGHYTLTVTDLAPANLGLIHTYTQLVATEELGVPASAPTETVLKVYGVLMAIFNDWFLEECIQAGGQTERLSSLAVSFSQQARMIHDRMGSETDKEFVPDNDSSAELICSPRVAAEDFRNLIGQVILRHRNGFCLTLADTYYNLATILTFAHLIQHRHGGHTIEIESALRVYWLLNNIFSVWVCDEAIENGLYGAMEALRDVFQRTAETINQAVQKGLGHTSVGVSPSLLKGYREEHE